MFRTFATFVDRGPTAKRYDLSRSIRESKLKTHRQPGPRPEFRGLGLQSYVGQENQQCDWERKIDIDSELDRQKKTQEYILSLYERSHECRAS
ncbi:hypothetical protein EVAR_90340_1 [Eumeta japonica]|uniref:Uncharacterized protein n=1 Tax=Eumeta variegata TaxID=151549 RepID=A0A4C1YFM0_EUMVA|nr:hypothetical protein EVAR_90340_1 [Eumeta japonica]